MKKVILSLVLVASVLTACKSEKKEKLEVKEAVKVEAVKVAKALNNVDLATSVITWVGSKPTGSHDGTVALKSGGMLIENGKLTKGEFVIDMTSITNKDMAGAKGATNIEKHLKSVDFFDVAEYPTAKFVITKVEEAGDKLAVTGNLLLKDTTKSITISATISTVDGVTNFKSEKFTIDRTDFGITYKSKKIDAALKDKFINDLMEMSFTVNTKA